MSPRDAAIKGMGEVASPVIAIALILSAVFIPDSVHSGDHRQTVSAVFHHDRDFGHLLCIQRAYA
jgi:multidrug efflux pump subunit AcrB